MPLEKKLSVFFFVHTRNRRRDIFARSHIADWPRTNVQNLSCTLHGKIIVWGLRSLTSVKSRGSAGESYKKFDFLIRVSLWNIFGGFIAPPTAQPRNKTQLPRLVNRGIENTNSASLQLPQCQGFSSVSPFSHRWSSFLLPLAVDLMMIKIMSFRRRG